MYSPKEKFISQLIFLLLHTIDKIHHWHISIGILMKDILMIEHVGVMKTIFLFNDKYIT